MVQWVPLGTETNFMCFCRDRNSVSASCRVLEVEYMSDTGYVYTRSHWLRGSRPSGYNMPQQRPESLEPIGRHKNVDDVGNGMYS